MEHNFDIKQALRVFSIIVESGEKVGDEHRYGGLMASSDFDGYNLLIRDGKVKLHIFFHNTHKFEFNKALDLENFLEKFSVIERNEAR